MGLRTRTVLRRAALTVSALGLLAAAGGAVALDEAWEVPATAPEPPGAVAVPAGDVALVCAGPAELTAGEGMSVDPEVDPEDVVPTARTTVLSLGRGGESAGPAAYEPLGDDADSQDLERRGDLRLLDVEEPAAGGVLRATPTGAETALAAGATVTRTAAGDLRGLAAAACRTAGPGAWLVGGSTEVGHSARLVLTNPGDTPAQVDATLWSSTGLIDAPRLTGITVAPGATTDVLLESVTGADTAGPVALRVESTGGDVTAAVQDLRLDGVVPAGVDMVTGGSAPATSQVVPGVVLPAPEGDGGEGDGEDGADGENDDGAADDGDGPRDAVRLVNPSEGTVTAAVRLLGPDGPVEVPGAEEVVLDPGAVLDLGLDGLPAGTYAAEVTADGPVAAAVLLTRPGEPGPLDPATAPVDLAWAPAAEMLETAVLTAPALADAATIVLANPGEDAVDAELTPVPGAPEDGARVVTVPARSTLAVDVAGLGEDVRAVVVDAEGPLASAVVLTAASEDGELIAVLPATADPHEARSVRVALR